MRAQVSVATVSRVLNGHSTVNEVLRERVEQAMRELRFRPNRIAQTLYHHRSKTIGCILPDIGNPFFSQLFLQLEIGAFERGYTMILGNTVSTRDMELTYLHALTERQVDGLLYLGGLANDPKPDPETLRTLHDIAERLPIVAVNGDVMDAPLAASVRADESGGTRDLIDLLDRHGHTRVAFLGGQLDVTTSVEKLQLYRAHYPDLPADWAQLTGLTVEAGRAAMHAVLDTALPPTACLCVNDLVAAGALAVAHERGLTVPQDLSIVGFDDIFVSQVVTPPLTSVNHNYAEVARQALEALLGAIEGHRPERHIRVPTLLVERQSVSVPPASQPVAMPAP